MPRTLGVDYEGVRYHVLNRGNYRQTLFEVHRTGEAYLFDTYMPKPDPFSGFFCVQGNEGDIGYTYSPTGMIKTWTQQAGTANPNIWTFGYDRAHQLRDAVLRDSGSNGYLYA